MPRPDDPPAERIQAVGVHRFGGRPVPLQLGTRDFSFVGYDRLRA